MTSFCSKLSDPGKFITFFHFLHLVQVENTFVPVPTAFTSLPVHFFADHLEQEVRN
jgi:hypothetical protein